MCQSKPVYLGNNYPCLLYPASCVGGGSQARRQILWRGRASGRLIKSRIFLQLFPCVRRFQFIFRLSLDCFQEYLVARLQTKQLQVRISNSKITSIVQQYFIMSLSEVYDFCLVSNYIQKCRVLYYLSLRSLLRSIILYLLILPSCAAGAFPGQGCRAIDQYFWKLRTQLVLRISGLPGEKRDPIQKYLRRTGPSTDSLRESMMLYIQ